MEGISVNVATSQVEPDDRIRPNDLANEMKNIRKAKLNRQVFEDPSMAGKLVAMKASPVYNASGNLIQALSSNLGAV